MGRNLNDRIVMRIIIALEHRFDRTPDGRVWTQTAFDYPFWGRYLRVFDNVLVVARVREVLKVPSDWKQADGEQVAFKAIAHYVGPLQFLRSIKQIKRNIKSIIRPTDAYLLRVPGTIGGLVWSELRRIGYPYALEVVGDPYDVFSVNAIKHFLRPIFRWWFSLRLKQQCLGACGVAYVTERALQTRYPASTNAFVTNYSTITLLEDDFVSSPRAISESKSSCTVITVGTLAQLYKAPDILIEAIGICAHKGLDVRLVLVGDGKHKQELEQQAARLGLGPKIYFYGQLSSGRAIIDALDKADLFVLPSRQEGLPRAMLEAMARALPCIGSDVGGIPELLLASDLVKPNNAIALAEKIQEVLASPKLMEQMSERNLEKARTYATSVLTRKREAYYRFLKKSTEGWQERHAKT